MRLSENSASVREKKAASPPSAERAGEGVKAGSTASSGEVAVGVAQHGSAPFR